MQSETQQFANRRSFPVHAEFGADHEWHSTGIAFEDFARMRTAQRAVAPNRQLETPTWAVNNTQLRELLVAFMEERAFPHKAGLQTGSLAERLANAQKKIIENSKKTLIPTIDRLCARLVSLKRSTPLTQDAQKQITQLENQIENIDTRLRFEAKDGGASLALGVAYFYFRLGNDSVAVGKQLGAKPPHIRQVVWRLRQTWAKLERWRLDPSTRPVAKAPKPKRTQPKRPPVDVERGAALLEQRHTLADAAILLGVSRGRLRAALAKAGLRAVAHKTKAVPIRPKTARERHVSIAEKLATENGGKIPTCGWLRANGHSTTYVFLRKHGDWFAHLARERAKTGPGAYKTTFDAARAVRLFKMGMSVAQIAVTFGYPPEHGNNRVRRALQVAGMYPEKKKPGLGGPAVADSGAASAVMHRPIIQQDNLALA
jgi:hypothetical protein